MNPLYERFPDFVEVDGSKCRVVTDFREWIKMIELLEDEWIADGQKAELLFQWYIDQPDNPEAGIIALSEFLKGSGLHTEHTGSDSSGRNKAPVFSYTEDAGCIFSAFLVYYGIDLAEISYMHWWKFLVLFEGLPEESEIKQRMMYRNTDLNSIKDKAERKRIKEIQRRIALPRKKGKVSDYDIGDIFA